MAYTHAELEEMAREIYGKVLEKDLDVNERGILITFMLSFNAEELLDSCVEPGRY